MNTTLDQDLSADHQSRLTAGLRDYDDQWIERERMANELQQRFESSRQREEEQDARLLDTAFQSEQRLLNTIESALLDDDHTANLSHAAVTIARLRSRLTEVTR
jgi:hypothetical protein